MGAIDISRFTDVTGFQDRIAEIIQRWGALKPLAAGEKVLYPGEPEALKREERLQTGIPVGLKLIAQFNSLAEQRGLQPLDVETSVAEEITSSTTESVS